MAADESCCAARSLASTRAGAPTSPRFDGVRRTSPGAVPGAARAHPHDRVRGVARADRRPATAPATASAAGSCRPDTGQHGVRGAFPRPARTGRRLRQGRCRAQDVGGPGIRLRRGGHRHRTAATGQPGAPDVPAARLARHRPDVPIGVNIGKTKTVPPEQAADDYRASARLVGPLASYLVVNVSSPNTPGLRDLQAVETLRPILSAVLEETSTPVLVKIAPDLADSDIDEIADLAVELGLAGIVATNTTVSRDGLLTPDVDRLGPGGISGPPLARRAVEVLRRLYGRVGDRLVLISVGGIETAADAWERITAGASLLQGYTGFIYGGGLWAKHIHDGIARRLHDGGFASMSEAVGTANSA